MVFEKVEGGDAGYKAAYKIKQEPSNRLVQILHDTARMSAKEREIVDEGRDRLSAQEYESILNLLAMQSIAMRLVTLDDRVRKVNRLPGVLGMLKWSITKVCEDIMDTIPLYQLEKLRHNLSCMNYTIGVKRPGGLSNFAGKSDQYGTWVSWDEFEQLLMCMGDHCLMCVYDPQEERKCTLRKHMEHFPDDIPTKNDRPGRCPYKDLTLIGG